jgi:hypothetical protein
MASQSCGVSVRQVPAPECTPLDELAPGSTCSRFAPRVAMVWRMAWAVPCPISIMVMTAAMPMTIPRQVSTERSKCRRKARKDVREVLYKERMAAREDPSFRTRE